MIRPILLPFAIAGASTLFAQANNYPNGSTVSDFTVTDTDGNVHNLYGYTAQGKYVILDFFFDTCPPCQATSGYFSQLHETYGCNAGDLVCIAVNNGTDTNAEVEAYEATYGGPYAHPPAIGIEGGCAAVDGAFGVSAYPTYCLIGPDNLMKNNDIWPVSNMSTFVAAFPTGSGIDAQACLTGVNEVAPVNFSLAPTLTNGPIELRLAASNARSVVRVTDMLGNAVLIADATGMTAMVLDLSALAEGQYLINLLENGVAGAPQRVLLVR